MRQGFGEPKILVEGIKLVNEALAAGLVPESYWSTTLLESPANCPCYLLPEAMYRQLSPTRSCRPPLAVFPAPKLAAAQPERGRYLLLDQVQEPGNAGALVRAAAAFSYDGVLWHQPCVYPFHHVCIRASAGSLFKLSQAIYKPSEEGCVLPMIGTGTDQAVDLESFSWPDSFALVMGNEGHGLSPSLANKLTANVRVQVSPLVESLNVAGAAHILMYKSRLPRANRLPVQ